MAYPNGYDYRKVITFSSVAGGTVPMIKSVHVGASDYPMETVTRTVNSKVYRHRMPIDITENTGGNLTNYQVHIPVPASWLKYWGYIDKTENGDSFEFADEDGTNTLKYYSYDTGDFKLVADYWVKTGLTASATKRIYLYFDPLITATSTNFDKDNTFAKYTGQVAAVTDDIRYWTVLYSNRKSSVSLDYADFQAGNNGGGFIDRSGARFQAVTVDQGAAIMESYLTLVASASVAATPVFTVLRCEAANNATAFLADAANPDLAQQNDFTSRVRTRARVEWYTNGATVNVLGAWTLGESYTSPDLSMPVEEVVTRVGWASGQALVVFWEDYAPVSYSSSYREAYGYRTGNTTNTPAITIYWRKRAYLAGAYTPPTVTVAEVPYSVGCDGDCNLFPYDIKFETLDDITIKHWLDLDKSFGDNALFWLQLPSNLAGDYSCYIYYKGPNATSDSTIFTFFQDFSLEAIDESAPHLPVGSTAMVVESGTWKVRYEGVMWDPWSPDGMWNPDEYKNAAGDYFHFPMTSWRRHTGPAIFRSRDKTNWILQRYVKLPSPLGDVWTFTKIKEGNWYYAVSDGCTDYDGTDVSLKHQLHMYRSLDLKHWECMGVISGLDYTTLGFHPYAAFITKFLGDANFYIYFNGTGGFYVSRCATIFGTYTLGNAGAAILVHGCTADVGYVEECKVYLEAGTYHMYLTSLSSVYFQYKASMRCSAIHPWGDKANFTDAANSWGVPVDVTFASHPDWMISNEWSPTMELDGATWDNWECGREFVAVNSDTNMMMSRMTKAALGAGDWTPVSAQCYRVFGDDFSGETDCQALWNFDTGALTVDSKGANTLTNNHACAESALHQQGTTSLLGDGANDYMSITDANLGADFPLKNGTDHKTFSLVFWLATPNAAFGSERIVISKSLVAGNKRSFQFGISAAGVPFIQLGYNGGSSMEQINFSTALAIHTWYHVAITYDNSDKSYRIHVWNQSTFSLLAADVTGTATLDVNKLNVEDTPFEILRGESPAGAKEYWHGMVDQLVVCSDVLTTTEIDRIRSRSTAPAARARIDTTIKNVGIRASLQGSNFDNKCRLMWRSDLASANYYVAWLDATYKKLYVKKNVGAGEVAVAEAAITIDGGYLNGGLCAEVYREIQITHNQSGDLTVSVNDIPMISVTETDINTAGYVKIDIQSERGKVNRLIVWETESGIPCNPGGNIPAKALVMELI